MIKKIINWIMSLFKRKNLSVNQLPVLSAESKPQIITRKMRRKLNLPRRPRDLFWVDDERTVFTYVSEGQIINRYKFLKRHGFKAAKV